MTLDVKRATSTATDPAVAARELRTGLAGDGVELVILFCAPTYDLAALGTALARELGDTPVIGCTTAGELTPIGYLDGAITGVSLSGPGVVASTVRIDSIQNGVLAAGDRAAHEALDRLRARGCTPMAANTFGFLLVDGLSMQEELLTSRVHEVLGGIPMFGGSAGDGLRFEATHVYHEARFRADCALLTLIQVPTSFVVFKTDHFVASPQKLVITGAEPARRVVTEINGAPAAREYARVVGLDISELTPMVFAAHPVVVTLGGSSYVRSIQKVNGDESLSFFCAIDEGIVLTVASRTDLVEGLARTFSQIETQIGRPALVLGCDCILRSIEIGQRGLREQVQQLLMANNVVGFASYGEQFNAMHVNQTFTGVALGAK